MICRLCERDLSESEFHIRSENGKLRTECKECIGFWRRNLNKSHRQHVKREYIELHGGKCSKCGYNKNYAALDFHHKFSELKDIEISKIWSRTRDVINIELRKCILVCANCHRELHNPDCEL